jgi:hypothetical protein
MSSASGRSLRTASPDEADRCEHRHEQDAERRRGHRGEEEPEQPAADCRSALDREEVRGRQTLSEPRREQAGRDRLDAQLRVQLQRDRGQLGRRRLEHALAELEQLVGFVGGAEPAVLGRTADRALLQARRIGRDLGYGECGAGQEQDCDEQQHAVTP